MSKFKSLQAFPCEHTTLDEVIREALELANKLCIPVFFFFGLHKIKVEIKPLSDPKKLTKQYWQEDQEKERSHRAE